MKYFLWEHGIRKRRLLRSSLRNAMGVGGEVAVIALLPADLGLTKRAGYWKGDELLLLAEEIGEYFDLNPGELFGIPVGDSPVMLAEARDVVLAAQQGAEELEGKRILLLMEREVADFMLEPLERPPLRLLPMVIVALLYWFVRRDSG